MFSEKRIAIALLVLLFAMQLAVLISRTDRQPHLDEIEYLHASWLMANGGQLFTTIFEHHSPFLLAAVATLAPHAERVGALPFTTNARLLAGFFGLVALIAYALIVWRDQPLGAPIAVAAFFASGSIWLHVIADVRAEPFALAFFWIGAALVVLPKKRVALLAGVGVGAIVLAGFWTPKWPLCSALIGICALIRARRQWYVPVLVATVIGFLGLYVLHLIAPLDTALFFMYDFSAGAYADLKQAPEFVGHAPFRFAPGLFSLPIIAAASVIVAAAAYLDRARRAALLFIALFFVAVLEIRFVHPYPAVWLHNYGLWSLSAAAILASLPAALSSLFARARISALTRAILPVTLSAIAMLFLLPKIVTLLVFAQGTTGTYWMSQRALVARMRPTDTVWMSSRFHPITVRDANHYWFGFDSGLLGVVNELRQTARGREYLSPIEPLPICASLRGRSTVRFVSAPKPVAGMESEIRCFAELQASRRVQHTGIPQVYEILPQHPAGGRVVF